MRLNKIILVVFFFFCSVFPIMAETMNFTQYYAIETNVKDDKELEKVIEQTHNELNGKTFEYTDTFFHPTGITTNTKFIKVDGEIKNFNKILIDTIKRDAQGVYSAKVCVYNIKNGKRTRLEKAMPHLYKYVDENDKNNIKTIPLEIYEFKQNIIDTIIPYSSVFCVVDYEYEEWLKEEKLKKKKGNKK